MDNAYPESSTAAFKIRNLDHFRTQKNRESPGWASVPKIEVPLDVVLTF